jgi:hypothetical protein
VGGVAAPRGQADGGGALQGGAAQAAALEHGGPQGLVLGVAEGERGEALELVHQRVVALVAVAVVAVAVIAVAVVVHW